MTEIAETEETKLLNQPQYVNYSNLPQICTSEHLGVCMCQKEIYGKFFRKNYKKEVTEVLLKQKELNVEWSPQQRRSVVENGERVAKAKALSETAKYCESNNIRCPIEKEEVLKDLRIFYNKYKDIWDDPRLQVVLDSLVKFKLSAHRMQMYSTKHGILDTIYDRDGNSRLVLNPVEAEKRKYDESRIRAVEILDKMIEGSKNVNVNITTDPIPIEDLYKGGLLK